MADSITSETFETDRRAYYFQYALPHLRMRDMLVTAQQQGFITAEELADPREDNRAQDRMVAFMDAARKVIKNNPSLLNAPTDELPRQVYSAIENDPVFKTILPDVMQAMAKTPSEPPHTEAQAKAFLMAHTLPAVIADIQSEAKAVAHGAEYFRQESASDPARIQKFVPDEKAIASVSARLSAAGGHIPMHGAIQGEYVVSHAQGGIANPPLVGTDYLMDCVAVVLNGVDPQRPDRRTAVVAHIDVATDFDKAVNELVSKVPQGYQINATLLGGPQKENPYMNTQLLHVLKENKRIGAIAHDTDAATTVVVDVASGTILYHAQKESEGTSEKIKDGEFPFPVAANFRVVSQDNNMNNDRDMIWTYLRSRTDINSPLPAGVLLVSGQDAIDRQAKNQLALSTMIESATKDHLLTQLEQRNILENAREIFGANKVELRSGNGELDVVQNGTILHVQYARNLKVEKDEPGQAR